MLNSHALASHYESAAPTDQPMKILVVDDQPANLFAMRQVLHPLDAQVITAQSGMEALSLTLRHEFSLVLMDVQMPGMDGMETAALMRQNQRTWQIPIIFVTANSQDERYVFKGYESGAVDYLMKPIDPHILRCKVRVFLELHQQRRELESSYADMEQFAFALRGLVRRGDAVGLDPAEMSRRVHGLLTAREATVRASLRIQETQEVSFLGCSYELHHERHALIRVLLSAFEEVAYMSQRLERVHAELEREIVVRREAEERALRASEAKGRFLACMSHELRTPLHAIIGFSQMIMLEAAGHGPGSRAAEDAQYIHEAGMQLFALISEILEMATLETGSLRIVEEEYDLAVLLDELATSFAPVAHASGNKLHLEYSHDIGRMCSDRAKLKQVMCNLLSNACKFTTQGTIRLAAERRVVDGVDWFVLRIADTGIGIAAEHLESVFEPFVQVDDRISRQQQGTGLGLAISKGVCELLGGRITVDSTVGRGSTFTVTLPARAGSLEVAAQLSPPPSSAPRTRT